MHNNHPLQNDSILKQLSKCLSYRQLKTGRLVSKKWNSSFFPDFEQITKIKADFNIDEKSIPTFVQTFSYAFDNGFIYKSIDFNTPENLDSPSMLQWMGLYGKNITALKLGGLTDDNLPRNSLSMLSFPRLLLEFCYNLKHLEIPFPSLVPAKPNTDYLSNLSYSDIQSRRIVSLETLKLGFGSTSTSNIYEDSELENVATFIFKLVKNVEHLTLISSPKNFNFYGLGLDFNDHADGLMTLAKFLRKGKVDISGLKSIDLWDYPTQAEALAILSNLDMKSLKSCRIGRLCSSDPDDSHEDYVARGNIRAFFNRYGGQLETLTQFAEYLSDETLKNCINFGEMQALRTFELVVQNNEDVTADFLLELPNLERFELEFFSGGNSVEEMRNFFGWEVPFLHLEQQTHLNMKIMHLKGLCDYFCVTKIVKCFPNLKDIQLFLMTQDLTESMTSLTKLAQLRELAIGIKKGSYNLEVALVKTMQDFTELREFGLLVYESENSSISCEEEYLVDLNADSTLAILRAPKIKHLVLNGVKISRLAFNIILENIGKLKVTRKDCTLAF